MVSPTLPDYPAQIEIYNMNLHGMRGEGGSIDLLKYNSFSGNSELVLYENMFDGPLTGKVIIQDRYNLGARLPLVGEEWIELDLRVPGQDETILRVPPLYVYSAIEWHDNDGLTTIGGWELSFSTYGNVAGKWNTEHLREEFIGPINELVEKIFEGAWEFSAGIGEGEEYQPEIEETSNKVWYRPQYNEYSRLRKDGPQKNVVLMNQLAENAVHKENQNAANFFFWQDIYGWKFKSIETLLEQEPKKIYCDSVSLDSANSAGGECSKINNIIHNITPIMVANQMDLAQSGAYASTFNYYRPRINVEENPYWMISGVDSFYYKTNCQFKDRFPAAIYGFQSTQDPDHRWHYAFAEVYLEYDYESHTPLFKIKPLDQNPIRSSIEFTEDGPSDRGDHFFEPVHNTMEMGNDNEEKIGRRGWEAPGMRIDTKMWEESCFKIQPIRGSDPHLSSTPPNDTRGPMVSEDWSDGDDVREKFPVVDMKIYKDVEGKPHYFFTAANAADGECNPEDADGDC